MTAELAEIVQGCWCVQIWQCMTTKTRQDKRGLVNRQLQIHDGKSAAKLGSEVLNPSCFGVGCCLWSSGLAFLSREGS